MRILGIDPGTNRIGYGFIEKRGGALKLIDFGFLEIAEKGSKKFLELAGKMEKLIETKKPDLASVEKLYFAKNRKTAIEVAQARGIIILELLKNSVPFVECSPSEIKQSVTGYGLNDKKAVAKMVSKILNVGDLKAIDDVTDALAIAITASTKARG